MHRLSRNDARRLAVRAQLLDADRPGDVVEVAEQVGEIKIDPTSSIMTAEHAALWSRIGWGYEPGHLKKAVEDDRMLVEYDGKFLASTVMRLQLALFPARALRASTRDYLEANADFRREVLARLRADGPLCAAEIADTSVVQADNAHGWYGTNQVPRMLELLGATGDVGIVGRDGRQRRWDIAERAYADICDPELTEADAKHELQARRLQAAGLAREHSTWTPVGDAGEPATVEGSSWTWRVDPVAVAALDEDPGGRVAVLNPYDRMLFDRPRLAELFDFPFVLEQFKPKAQRVYGAFTYPILIGDRFVGLLDAALDKKKETLVVGAVHELEPFDGEEKDMVDAELRDLAQWLGVDLSSSEIGGG